MAAGLPGTYIHDMPRKIWVALLLAIAPSILFAQGVRKDPLTNFAFTLKVGGVAVGSFKEVSGLSTESEVVEYRSGGAPEVVQKIPGRLKVGDVTLKRGITSDMSLAAWRKLVEDGAMDQARQNASILLLNASAQPVAQWNLINAWASKLSIEVDKESGEVMEVVVLAVERIERK